MSSIEFVEAEVAREASGVRLLVSGVVPSPWSEAAKGLFRLQRVPVLAVRSTRGSDLPAWAQSHNVPVVLFDREPPRTSWSAIVGLAERLGPPDALLPSAPAARARAVGWIHELAGEGGIGWNGRLLMIHASFATNGERGFPLPVAQYLAAKYGYAEDRIDAARARMLEVLSALRGELGDAPYFGGSRPNALDVYAATFLTPVTAISETDCPRMLPMLRVAFGAVHEALGDRVPPELLAQRRRMFEGHLAWPIEL
jgi:glutathione S-transferase